VSAPDSGEAVAYLLRLLARRDYARAELDQRLSRKGADEATRRAALDRLAELGLLNDRLVADLHVRSHQHRKGRLALRRDLSRRGFDDEVRDVALQRLDDDQQAEAAREVLRKEAWRFASGDRRKDVAKAAAFLRRRGFPADTVHQAIEERFSEDGFSDADLDDGSGESVA